MIEAYAFLAMFAVQILALSVLYPAWYIRRTRVRAAGFPAGRLAQAYPGVDLRLTLERYLTRYRVVNIGIAVLGVLLLGWLFTDVQRPDWDDGVVKLVGGYSMLQMLPIFVAAWLEARFNKALRRSLPEDKRKAVLQRRGLFDFVSPFVVFLAALAYIPFAGFMIYLWQHQFPGYPHPLFRLGGVTLTYALMAFAVHRQLYGRKKNPLETHAYRVQMIGLGIKVCVYSCIAMVVFTSLNVMLQMQDLEGWRPFAHSVLFVVAARLCAMGVTALPRDPEADALGPSPVS